MPDDDPLPPKIRSLREKIEDLLDRSARKLAEMREIQRQIEDLAKELKKATPKADEDGKKNDPSAR